MSAALFRSAGFAFAVLAFAARVPALGQATVAAAASNECAALQTVRIELSKYGSVDLLSIDAISVAGAWAFVSFRWGGAGGDALLVRNGGSWILRRAGGGEMSEPILAAFGVDASSAALLRTTQKAPPGCSAAPHPLSAPSPATKPTLTAKPTPAETRIPADQPLGTKYPMLITTIDLRIQCLQKFADDDWHTDFGQWPGYVEDAISDGERGAPHDPAIPRFIYGMEIYYKKAHRDADVARLRFMLRKNYPKSAHAKESLYQIGVDAKRPAVCHLGAREFAAPVTNKTP